MSDLDIIKQIEILACTKLEKLNEIKWNSRGYTINQREQVNGLSLYACKIKNIENFVIYAKGLPALTQLHLIDNHISDILALKELKDLKVLLLNENQIRDISSLKEMKHLTKLSLSGNLVSDISNLKKITSLTHLYIENNQIENIYPIGDLKNIQRLSLRENKISNIKPLKELKSLEQLDLGHNKISDISPLKGLVNLSKLNLSDNQIYILHSWIIDFKMDIQWKDDWTAGSISLYNNPFKSPPLEIVQQGKSSLQNYFTQLTAQGKDYIYEAKIMIVGEPGAGKTSLMNKLFNRSYQVPPSANNIQKSTLGIDVMSNWEFQLKNTNFKAHIWDFGGQQVQYMLHQFFLTPDCLYILMAEKRRELTNFDYWLNIINVLGKNSPVIILFNEINIDSATSYIYDEKKYKDLFPALHLHDCDIDLSNIDDGRFDMLMDLIKKKITELEHIGKEVPARWVDIRLELEKLKGNRHIHIDEYFKICHNYGIDEDSGKYILKYFHILGFVLWFYDDISLRDTLFLDPNWTIDAVYAVLTDEEIQNNFGEFKEEKVDSLWEKKGYSFDARTKLFKLMLKDNFELCYKLPIKKKKYLVPMLLPKVRSQYKWDTQGNQLFRFQYPFMPKGIVSRLIVRLNNYIEHDKIWSEGAVFNKEDARAQVIEKETTKEGLKIIEIQLAGIADKRKELLTIIREEIHDIQNSSFPALPFYEMIPCNCSSCSNASVPEFYNYKNLLNLIFKNIFQKQCEISGEMVNIAGLIDAVYEKQDIQQRYSGPINYINVIGNENKILQDIAESSIKLREKNNTYKSTDYKIKIKELEQIYDKLKLKNEEFENLKDKCEKEAMNKVKKKGKMYLFGGISLLILFILLMFIVYMRLESVENRNLVLFIPVFPIAAYCIIGINRFSKHFRKDGLKEKLITENEIKYNLYGYSYIKHEHLKNEMAKLEEEIWKQENK